MKDKMIETSLPMSREGRIATGKPDGWTEDLLYKAHISSTSELGKLMDDAELLRMHERAKAAEALALILFDKMTGAFGSIIDVDVRDALKEFHEDEILDLRPKFKKMQFED